jgi:hypothetical protein
MSFSKKGGQVALNDDETRELFELLEESARSDWKRRCRRLRAAETRLGMREGGRFTGKGLAEILHLARKGEPLTLDQFIVANFGFLKGERQAIERRKQSVSRDTR